MLRQVDYFHLVFNLISLWHLAFLIYNCTSSPSRFSISFILVESHFDVVNYLVSSFLLNWNIVYLWYCVSFRYTAKWFSCLFQVCFHYRLLQDIKYSSQYCCCCCCCCCITSVVSDSVRPHRRQPTRLLCPWDIPGKNTGMVCHFLLQCILSCFSHVWLCITPGTAAHQAPLSMEFSGQEYWSGLPFPSPLCITVLVYFTYGSIYLLISNFQFISLLLPWLISISWFSMSVKLFCK